MRRSSPGGLKSFFSPPGGGRRRTHSTLPNFSGYASALQIPAILWHSIPQDRKSTAIAALDKQTVATGDVDGRVVIWRTRRMQDVSKDLNTGESYISKPSTEAESSSPNESDASTLSSGYFLVPCTMSLGHASPIVSLDFGLHEWGKSVLLSCDESGALALWSVSSGHCFKCRSFYPRTGTFSYSSAKHSAIAGAHFFSDKRHALMVHLNGGLEVIDTWTMTLVFDLPHISNLWGWKLHVSAIPFTVSKHEQKIINRMLVPGLASKSSKSSATQQVGLDTEILQENSSTIESCKTFAIVSVTESGVASLWCVVAGKRHLMARSGVRGTETDNLGSAVRVCCASLASKESEQIDLGNVSWVLVTHNYGCRVLALENKNEASLVFVEHYTIGCPAPHSGLCTRPAWVDSGLARASLKFCNSSRTTTCVSIYLTDSASRCAFTSFESRVVADTNQTGSKSSNKVLQLDWKYLPESRTPKLPYMGCKVVPVVHASDCNRLYRISKGIITTWCRQESSSQNVEESRLDAGSLRWQIVDVANSSRGFETLHLEGGNHQATATSNSGRNKHSPQMHILLNDKKNVSNLRKSIGGLLLHLELGAAIPSLVYSKFGSSCTDANAPIFVRVIENGHALQFTTTMTEDRDENAFTSVRLPVLETEYDRYLRNLFPPSSSQRDTDLEPDRKTLKATCIASLRSRRFSRWVALHTGVINKRCGTNLSDDLAMNDTMDRSEKNAVENTFSSMNDAAREEVNKSSSNTTKMYKLKSTPRPRSQFFLLLGCQDGTVRIHSVSGQRTRPYIEVKVLKTLHTHDGPVGKLYVQDNRDLYTLSSIHDSLGRDFTVRGEAEVIRIANAERAGALVSQLEDDLMFCSAGAEDGTVCVHSLTEVGGIVKADCIHSLSGHTSPVIDVQWDAKAGFTFCSVASGDTWVWNTKIGELDRVVPTTQMKHILTGGNNDQVTNGGQIGSGAHFIAGHGFGSEETSWEYNYNSTTEKYQAAKSRSDVDDVELRKVDPRDEHTVKPSPKDNTNYSTHVTYNMKDSIDLYSGDKSTWKISQGRDTAHPFLFGDDPQTISGIDAINGGGMGFFGTGENNELRNDGQWKILRNSQGKVLYRLRKPDSPVSSKDSGTNAGDFFQTDAQTGTSLNISPQTRLDRSRPNRDANDSYTSRSRNLIPDQMSSSSVSNTLKSIPAYVYASTSAIRTRCVPASLKRLGRPYNSKSSSLLTTTSEGIPVGHILHMSIPGLVRRAESWLKAQHQAEARVNGDGNGVKHREESTWSEDRDLSLISLLLAWGVDKQLDEDCVKSVGLKRISLVDAGGLSLGTYGCEGTMTFAFPTELHGERRFIASPELSTLHRLAIVTFFMSLMPVAEMLQKVSADSSVSGVDGIQFPLFFSKMITHYGIVFPDRFSKESSESMEDSMREAPSLGLLAHFAVSSWETASVGARLLLQAIIERMPEHSRKLTSSMWSEKLHTLRNHVLTEQVPRQKTNLARPLEADASSSRTLKRSMETKIDVGHDEHINGDASTSKGSPHRESGLNNGSYTSPDLGRKSNVPDSALSKYVEEAKFVLILGMIGVVYPQDLSPATARVVTDVFLSHIFNGTAIFSTVAMELMGKGFPLWRPHIPDLPRLLRHLLETIFHHSKKLRRQRLKEEAAIKAQQISYEAAIKEKSQPRTVSGYNSRSTALQAATAATASAVAAARHALMEVGASQPLLFLSSVGKEVTRQDMGSTYHRTCLDCISQLVRDNSVQMVRHLSVTVEAVIRPLYPGEPMLRKMCLVGSTLALHDLVKRFPMVAFHQQTQRLACGTNKGRIVIYDLRTATKWRILENSEAELQGAISVVAFNTDGNFLASYSADDACICTWTASSGGFLGGILGIQGRRKQKIHLNKCRVGNAVRLDKVLQNCRLQFGSRQTHNNRLKLRREDGQIVTIGLKG